MIRKFLVSAVLVALVAATVPEVVVLEDGFLPPNNLKIPVGSMQAKGITEAQFNQVMDRIEEIYGPDIAARGGRLVLRRLWEDDTVNASAQRWGDDYILNMYGGLARHETVTQDGMALVACHEMGHHIGGAPKYDGGADWASNEGQSDYFANLKCLRRVFASAGASSFTRLKSDDSGARASCELSFMGTADRELCVRGAMAGMSVSTLLQQLGGEPAAPRFDTPDTTVVDATYDPHPAAQCRLDTYFAGSVCYRKVSDEVDGTDPNKGTCGAGAALGQRPLCWYKPAVAPAPAPVEPVPEGVARQRAHPKAPSTLTSLLNPELWQGL